MVTLYVLGMPLRPEGLRDYPVQHLTRNCTVRRVRRGHSPSGGYGRCADRHSPQLAHRRSRMRNSDRAEATLRLRRSANRLDVYIVPIYENAQVRDCAYGCVAIRSSPRGPRPLAIRVARYGCSVYDTMPPDDFGQPFHSQRCHTSSARLGTRYYWPLGDGGKWGWCLRQTGRPWSGWG